MNQNLSQIPGRIMRKAPDSKTVEAIEKDLDRICANCPRVETMDLTVKDLSRHRRFRRQEEARTCHLDHCVAAVQSSSSRRRNSVERQICSEHMQVFFPALGPLTVHHWQLQRSCQRYFVPPAGGLLPRHELRCRLSATCRWKSARRSKGCRQVAQELELCCKS